WDEATVSFDTAPGVVFDGHSGTRSLDRDQLLLLGEFSTAGAAEGDIVSFTNPDLSVFLNLLAYRDADSSEVTLLVERQNNSTSQTTFASKEATSLASGSPVEPGTYAPRLNIEALWNWEADFNDDNVVD